MIFKILKIKNLGRLNIPLGNENRDENKNDDFAFKKNTLIFADNTYGKTTLVSIFKSLKNGNSLEARKRFNSKNNIQIKIQTKSNGSNFHEYGKSSWENKNILIFDNDFIKDHIFSEDQIKSEHLKSLPKILIGDGVKEDIKQIKLISKCNDDSCRVCEICLTAKLSKHKNIFNKEYNLEDFLRVNNKVLDVNNKIKEKEDVLSIDEKLSKLKKVSEESNFYKFDIKLIKKLFDRKISNDFESIIEDHLSKKTKNLEKARGFLGYGLELKKNNICPFCSQDITDVQDFIDNLSSYFNQEYIDFKKEIERDSNIFLSFDLEKEIAAFANLEFTFAQELFDKSAFIKAIRNIKNKIEKKVGNLNFDCDFANDADFILLEKNFSKAKVVLKDIINKGAFLSAEKVNLNKELNILKLNKYKYSKEGINFENEYKSIEGVINENRKKKVKVQDSLKKKINTIFKNNLENINYFLEELRADFKIKKLTPSIDNRDKNNFLKINEYSFEFVDIQGNASSVETGQFKEIFSDSDKRLLGFAFFLSLLKSDLHLKNKIIVLDDPFSSFDINRKEETIKLFDNIQNISNEKPIQKIIFTHDKNFYCKLNNLISSSDKSLLKLNYSETNDGTMFELVDIKKFESDEYYSDLDYINNSINTSTRLDEALPKARKCVEYLLKAKYINTLEAYKDSNGKPIDFNKDSIDKFLKAIADKCKVKNNISDLGLHQFHHNQPSCIMELTDTNKKQKLKDFVKLIEKI